jgi:hypothetical protein
MGISLRGFERKNAKRLKQRCVRREGEYPVQTVLHEPWGFHLQLSIFESNGWALTSFSTTEVKSNKATLRSGLTF